MTAEEFGGGRTVAERESSSRVSPEPETVIPEPIVESGPVELAAAEAEEEEEAAQGHKHAWALLIRLKYCNYLN